MKFVTNKISTGKGKSLNDIMNDIIKGRDEKIKTASTEENVKTAEADEAESSGQLDVEPLHQTGESTTMPKNGPSAKKDDGTKAVKAKTDTEEEGKDSGQPKAEGSEKFTNDPEEPSKEEKGGASEKETKEAGEKGMCECGKPNFVCKGKCKKEDGKEEDKDEEKEAKVDKDKDEEEKEASGPKFVKVANLNAKNKTFLREFWTKIYPSDFVEALLADK